MPDEEELETIEGNAGEATEAEGELESVSDFEMPDLDERQRLIRDRRKPGGPPLPEGEEGLESVEEGEEVPPTDPEESAEGGA